MPAGKTPIKILWIVVLLLAALACRAATRPIIPDTPTPVPTATATLTPTPSPTVTPTAAFEAACPALLAKILKTSTSEVIVSTEKSKQSFEEDDLLVLISYKVSEGKISSPHNRLVPEEFQNERKDRAAHKAIWDYFVAITPPEERASLAEFYIFTDGRGKRYAAVSQSSSDPEQWILYVDIVDAQNDYDLTYSLVHEQGHLLTLDAKQVPPSKSIFKFPENKTVYKQEAAACRQYFPGEGCSTPDSYINQFFTRFWTALYPEWEQIDLEKDKDARTISLEEFYKTYEDQFLSDYAATSPEEDIAEAWTFFVLSPKPDASSIAGEKFSFFYEYPELVELRTQILKRICVEFPK